MKPRFLLATLAPALLSAAYTYYLETSLTSIHATDWWTNGSVSTSSAGLTSSAVNGGSVISKIAVPGGNVDYEVQTKLTLTASGGTYVQYLRASSDAMTGPASQGTFYSVELQNPTFNGGSCTGTGAVYRRQSGTTTLLTSVSVACYDGMMITTFLAAGELHVYFGDWWILGAAENSIPSGQPGVGVLNAPASNTIQLAKFGARETVPPNAISSVDTNVLPNRVEMQWVNPGDDANGRGMFVWTIVRNGTVIAFPKEPSFADAAVSPATTYNYVIHPRDLHGNYGTPTAFTVVTPASGTRDPKRIGIRSTGAYWGSGGENIDMRSGNLNYTVPLVRAQKRGGSGITFSLNYNSQLWRKDPGGTWKAGWDLGYGFGWRMLAGSITPVWQDYWTVHHYVFTDSTGAEYRLDVNTGGVWTSSEALWLSYEAATEKLYFNDGSYWLMQSTSWGSEPDLGTKYPTKYQDSNGNQVIVSYRPGNGVGWWNSSSRVEIVEDVRAKEFCCPYERKTYKFFYNADAIPHLTSIQTSVDDGANYSFEYSPSTVVLRNPFTFTSFGDVKTLNAVETAGIGVKTTFQYVSGGNAGGITGELWKVIYPHGGELQWDYRTFTYTGTRSLREVQYRRLRMTSGGTQHTYTLSRDDAGDASKNTHAWTRLDDAGGLGRKQWFFDTTGASAYFGLQTQFDEISLPSTVKRRSAFTWALTTSNNPYVFSELSTHDVGAAYQKQSKTEQDVNAYGLVTERRIYDFGTGSTPATTPRMTYRTAYVTDSNYTSRYIRSLVDWQDMKLNSGPWISIVDNTFDNYSGANSLVNRGALAEHDWQNYGTSYTYRGNVTTVHGPGGTQTFRYDTTGMVETATNGSTSVQVTPGSNNAVPYQVTPNGTSSLATTMSWNSFLGLTQESGPNGASVAFGYDSFGRNSAVTSPHGASTSTTWVNHVWPATKTDTVSNGGIAGNGRWTKTTFDGFGRPTKVESGYASTTLSTVETQYAPCACSPLGKVSQATLPYAPAATKYWTVYTYDALGRTLTAAQPSAAGNTTYLYEGNTVKVTDPAGKWKKFTMNALGQMTQVNEPNPAGGADYATTYTYDVWGNLNVVSMPRPTGTQTRTFTYNSTGQLYQSILPENGTSTYGYNADKTLASKIDAKGQLITYTYDAYKRLTQVKRYPDGSTENVNLRTNHYYDSNPFDGSFTQNGSGRKTATEYWVRRSIVGGSPEYARIVEMYSYTTGGLPTKKRAIFEATKPGTPTTYTQYLESQYTYDSEGRRTQMKYPPNRTFDQGTMQWVETPGRQLDYTFDSMGRPNTMTSPDPMTWIGGVTYNAAGQATNIGGETRQYNTLGQLTRITNGSAFDEEYKYSTTGANNGRITSKKNHLSGEEVLYTYDSLQRLASAITVGPEWGNNYGYDGFGNLVSATVVKGTAPALSFSINAANNRVVGQTYDANGNQAWGSSDYDVDNRLWKAPEGTTPQYYGYDGGNKRVYKNRFLGYDGETGNPIYDENLTFYGVGGERVGEYTATWESISGGSSYVLRFTEKKTLVWFGSKLLREGQWNIIQDRLGSVRRRQLAVSPFTVENADYYPYGGEKPSVTTQGREKFATYLRDETGLDYADQRYHWPDSGRFMSPDPYQASGEGSEPGSWNRYSYAGSDPANNVDPQGLFYSTADLLAKAKSNVPSSNGASCLYGGVPYPAWHVVCSVLPLIYGPPTLYPQTSDDIEIMNDLSPSARAKRMLTDAVAVAAIMLAKPDCMALFEGENPLIALYALMGTYDAHGRLEGGAIEFGNIGNRAGQTTTGGAATVGQDGGKWGNRGFNGATWSNGLIQINLDDWLQRSAVSQATTLIHELGHMFNLVTGLGSSAIEYDLDLATGLPDEGAQARNRTRLKACDY